MTESKVAPVTITGTCQAKAGVRRVQAVADLCLHPDPAAGHHLLRVTEARLYGRPPEIESGRLRAQFLLDIRYDTTRPHKFRTSACHHQPLVLTAALPAHWAGQVTVEQMRTRLTGVAISPDRNSLLAGLQLSVRMD